MKFDISYVQRNCRGEVVCGDAVSIVESPDDDITHIAVVDGLGHGPAANAAANEFVKFFEAETMDVTPLPVLLQNATVAIAKTRGVAASVVRLNRSTRRIQFAGVGNVELHAVSASPIRPISKPGIIGRRLGRIIEFDYALHMEDLIVIFTDGISSRFNLENYRDQKTEVLCKQILDEWGKDHDDATILAIRCQ